MQNIRFDIKHHNGRLKLNFSASQVRLIAQVLVMTEEIRLTQNVESLAKRIEPYIEEALSSYVGLNGYVKGFKDWYLDVTYHAAISVMAKSTGNY